MAALSPPFTANDMQGLYRKVIKGVYSNIPKCYSQELSNIIRSMLSVNPVTRPSCDQILENPSIARYLNQRSLHVDESNGNLLGTIAFVPNFKALKTKLPKAKYENKERGLSASSSRDIDVLKNDLSKENKPRVISSARHENLLPKVYDDALNLEKLPSIEEPNALPSRRIMPTRPSPKNKVGLSPSEKYNPKPPRLPRVFSKPEIVPRDLSRQNSEHSLDLYRPESKQKLLQKIDSLVPSPPSVQKPPRQHRNLNRIASIILGSPKAELPKPEPLVLASPMANRLEYMRQQDPKNPVFSPHQVEHSRINRPANKPVWWG